MSGSAVPETAGGSETRGQATNVNRQCTCKSEITELVTVTCHIRVKNKCPPAPAAFRSLPVRGSGGASFALRQVWYVAWIFKAALPTLPAVVPESSQKHLEFSPQTQIVVCCLPSPPSYDVKVR